MRLACCLAVLLPALGASTAAAQDSDKVLVIVNERSPRSRAIAEYYARKRSIPANQILRLKAPLSEEISREEFNRDIQAPIASFLREKGWIDRIHYIVTTHDVPLKISGKVDRVGDAASVDSELATLYQQLRGLSVHLQGFVDNPYYRKSGPFRHPQHALYMVTRLTGYTFEDVKRIIDKSLAARNFGRVVLDLKSFDLDDGNYWLKLAAEQAPKRRVKIDEGGGILSGIADVIFYASWGSNDPARKSRFTKLHWLPGAIATQYVSTDARTFKEPPPDWEIGPWGNPLRYFEGSPQSLTADLIREGVTGASGHVYEPFLQYSPRPNVLVRAYVVEGRNLAESFYAAMPVLSWMNVIVGDPLCRLAP